MGTIKYLVKLTPHEKFYFGGEQTFGEKSGKDDTTETNYLVKSNYFPQQTSILGLIRHQLLIQSDENVFKENKIQDSIEASKLIGESGFSDSAKFPLGKIHSISPVFLSKNTGESDAAFFFPANKEYQKYTKFNDSCTEVPVNLFLELVENAAGAFILKDFDPKYPFDDFLINKANTKLKYDDVFIEKRQVGIHKNYDGSSDDDAYFIQSFYTFKKTDNHFFSFSFIVELDDSAKFETKQVVTFGGEQQLFKLEVIPNFKQVFEQLIPDYEATTDFDKVVLVSDAYVENNEIFQKSAFAITETIDFRFIKTCVSKSANYYNKPEKSRKVNLIKRGSVFYGDIKLISESLKNDTFNKIGYNIYKIINKK